MKRPFYKVLYLLNQVSAKKKKKRKKKKNISRTSGTHKVATVLIFLHSHKVYWT